MFGCVHKITGEYFGWAKGDVLTLPTGEKLPIRDDNIYLRVNLLTGEEELVGHLNLASYRKRSNPRFLGSSKRVRQESI